MRKTYGPPELYLPSQLYDRLTFYIDHLRVEKAGIPAEEVLSVNGRGEKGLPHWLFSKNSRGVG